MIFYLRAKYHANLPIESDRWVDDYIAIASGAIYTVRIRQKLFGRIEVQTMRHDDPLRELVGARITYPNLFMFFADWEPLHVSQDPTKFEFHFNKGV
jgi:hypothetical protein